MPNDTLTKMDHTTKYTHQYSSLFGRNRIKYNTSRIFIVLLIILSIIAFCFVNYINFLSHKNTNIYVSNISDSAFDDRLPAPAPLNEMHGEWHLFCDSQNKIGSCIMSQRQFDPKSKSLVIAMEIDSFSSQYAAGRLTMPFGLSLSHGVSFSTSSSREASYADYHSCNKFGCNVPLNMEAEGLVDFKNNSEVNIMATLPKNYGTVTFSIPTSGFEAAYEKASLYLRTATPP